MEKNRLAHPCTEGQRRARSEEIDTWEVQCSDMLGVCSVVELILPRRIQAIFRRGNSQVQSEEKICSETIQNLKKSRFQIIQKKDVILKTRNSQSTYHVWNALLEGSLKHKNISIEDSRSTDHHMMRSVGTSTLVSIAPIGQPLMWLLLKVRFTFRL